MENYHTHTYRCKHAQGDIKDYIEVAKAKGFTGLGISDHTPLPDGWWSHIRMGMEELEDYVNQIREAQRKYTDFPILLGMECDCQKKYESFYQEVFKEQYHLDYLIGSLHGIEDNGDYLGFYGENLTYSHLKAYTEQYVAAISSGIYTFMGHPDLFGLTFTKWDKELEACSRYILEAAASYHMPLEINTSGYAKKMIKAEPVISYPIKAFWEMAADYPIEVIINSDAHDPMQLDLYLGEGEQLAQRYHLHKISLPDYLCHLAKMDKEKRINKKENIGRMK